MEEVLYEIILDLHKAYDALDHGRRLDILVVYGVVNQAILLLWKYWDRLTIKPTIKAVETRSRASCGSPTFVATTISST